MHLYVYDKKYERATMPEGILVLFFLFFVCNIHSGGNRRGGSFFVVGLWQQYAAITTSRENI